MGHGGPGLVPWSSLIDQREHVPELQWPTSTPTYERMLTDAQIAGVLFGLLAPVRRRRWMIEPNGARPEIVAGVAADLGLPVRGADPGPRPRRQGRFSHDHHLAHALRALAFGHYFFEQVGEIGDDGLWHLRKLAPRPPASISEVKVARDGGLLSIRQQVGLESPEILVNRLVAYVWEQEAGNWLGRSVLRPMYKHWLIKDRLLRVDAIKHERNGLGVPVVEAPPDASREQIEALDAMAQSFKAGEASGAATPHGAKLRLVGTEGSLPDTIASIRYHDEQIARSLMMMFAQLGTTASGSRALGESLIDYTALAQDAIAGWYADVTSEHVIEDWVDWNYGLDEQAPLLMAGRDEDSSFAVADLVSLIDSGAIVVDEDLEAALRQRGGLPVRTTPRPAPAAPAASGRRRLRQRPPAKAATGTFRRELFPHEVAAATDFAAVQATWTGHLDALLDDWRDVRAGQIDELVEAISRTDDLATLAALEATPTGAELLASRMDTILVEGAEAALAEAAAQGLDLPMPDLDEAREALAARAEAMDTLLARSLSEAASRQAVVRTGGSLSATEVAGLVREHLEGLSDSYLADQLGGTLTQAQEAGRRAAMAEGEPEQIYASALNDGNVCVPCAEWDGHEFASLAEAEAQFPTGGNVSCLGGPRCRCTLVAVYEDEV